MWRAYIAQHKYRVVLDGITDSPSTASGLKAIRKVAEYFNSIGKLSTHLPLHCKQNCDLMMRHDFRTLSWQAQRINVMPL